MRVCRMAKKKNNSNFVGWVILGLIAFGIFHFGVLDNLTRPGAPTRSAAAPQPSASAPAAASIPLSAPRFVNVASLNVRHAPSATADLIMALPRGTQLRVLDRQNGWLLIDLNTTLEGWVAERLTTTQNPKQPYQPPASLLGSR